MRIDRHPDLLVGLDRADDAGVYRLTDEIALVQTVDFFTPIVDDPYTFGQIAVANSLSDVYAMGGKPLCAMNIVAFPIDTMDISVLKDILAGGLDKMREADVALVGGHSVTDPELKYGLSVTGTVHPDLVLTNVGARKGDRLILTKPLGTGIVNTAIKGGLASASVIEAVTRSMATLNRKAAQTMLAFGPTACTDVTGFGILGHSREMLDGTGLSLRVSASSLPFFAEAREYADMGLLPAGLHRNLEHWKDCLVVSKGVDRFFVDLVSDPQTSGGLLVAVPRDVAEDLVGALVDGGIDAVAVGEVLDDGAEKVYLEA